MELFAESTVTCESEVEIVKCEENEGDMMENGIDVLKSEVEIVKCEENEEDIMENGIDVLKNEDDDDEGEDDDVEGEDDDNKEFEDPFKSELGDTFVDKEKGEDPLVIKINCNDDEVKANEDCLLGNKADVSSWMSLAQVLDFEKNAVQALESDGIVTYISGSEGELIEKGDTLWNCLLSKNDAHGNDSTAKETLLFMCKLCGRRFENESNLKHHSQNHSDNEVKSVPHGKISMIDKINCLGKIDKLTTLEADKKSNKTDPQDLTGTCLQCKESFPSEYIVQHTTVCSTYCCQICGIRFNCQKLLTQHEEKDHHKSQPASVSSEKYLPAIYECQECDEKFTDMPLLVSHSLSAHPPTNKLYASRYLYDYRCRECSILFSCQATYVQHLLDHSKSGIPVSTNTGKRSSEEFASLFERDSKLYTSVGSSEKKKVCSKSHVGSSEKKIAYLKQLSRSQAEKVNIGKQSQSQAELDQNIKKSCAESSSEDCCSNQKLKSPVRNSDKIIASNQESREGAVGVLGYGLSLARDLGDVRPDSLGNNNNNNNNQEIKSCVGNSKSYTKKPRMYQEPLKFKCPYCNRRLMTANERSTHVDSHNACLGCCKVFRNKSELDNHICKISSEEVFSCHSCFKVCKNRQALTEHKRRVCHKGLPCWVCSKLFSQPYSLARHIASHSEADRKACSCSPKDSSRQKIDKLCGRRFENESDLKQHSQSLSDDEAKTVPHGKVSNNQNSQNQSDDEVKTVPHGKVFKNDKINCLGKINKLTTLEADKKKINKLTTLEADKKKINKLTTLEADKNKIDKLMTLEADKKKIDKLTTLEADKKKIDKLTTLEADNKSNKTDPQDPTVKCLQCKESFASEDIVQHLTVCLTYCCQICGIRFSSQKLLTQHYIVHEEIDHHKSQSVSVSSDKSSALVYDIVQHATGGSPVTYKCQECDEEFTDIPLLVSHSLSAHPSTTKEPYTCTSLHKYRCKRCSILFTDQATYVQHLMDHSKSGIPVSTNPVKRSSEEFASLFERALSKKPHMDQRTLKS